MLDLASGFIIGTAFAGLGNFKAQGSQDCPYCEESVAIDATKCKFCTADIEPGVLDDDSPQITTETRVAD